MEEHYKLWEEAIESSRAKVAEFHMREYLNYKELEAMFKRVNDGRR